MQLVIAALVPLGILAVIPFCIWAERRVSAVMQDRRGPNRASIGPLHLLGLPHTLADAIKFATKESFIPANANKPLYFIAPFFAVAPVIITFVVIPFADSLQINGQTLYIQALPMENGLIFFFALAAMSVFSIILGGWSSGNRYSLLGGLRSSAQMVSYEIALALSLVGALMLYGTAELNTMVQAQGAQIYRWGFVYQPLGFLIFFITGVAETERIPFDIPEAESEVVAGFHTEYSGLKFSMYMLGQYVTTLAISAIAVTVFLGGWQIPFLSTAFLNETVGEIPRVFLQVSCFTGKLAVLMWFFIWIRWSLPRFRYDRLMDLGWKVFIELALLNILVTGFILLLLG